MLVTYVFLVFLGFTVGVLSGFFGIGGAFIITPVLNGLGFPIANSVAAGLTFTVGVSGYGSFRYLAKEHAFLKVAAFVGGIGFVGVFIAQEILFRLDAIGIAETFVRLTYTTMLLSLAGLLVADAVRRDAGPNRFVRLVERIRQLPPFLDISHEGRFSLISLVFAGLFIGLIKGLTGAGGFLLFPLLMYAFGMNCDKAVGTSLAILVVTSVFASVLYFLSGNVDLPVVAFLILGAFFGIDVGVKAAKNISDLARRKLYTFFLSLTAFSIVMQEFRNLVSLYLLVGSAALVSLVIIVKYYLKRSFPTVRFLR